MPGIAELESDHYGPEGVGLSPCALTELGHLRFRLLQPVRHPHLAVHRRCGGEMLLRLLTLARAPVELAEAEVLRYDASE